MQKNLYNITQILKQGLEKNNKEVIFLCVGSSKITGDSIGPRVGSLLKEQKIFQNVKIYGDMKKTITAKNILEIKDELKEKYIIAIDSAMGKRDLIENIYISNTKTKLGRALDKNLEELGDISIKACVCENLYDPIKNYHELRKVDINLINKLSNQIFNVICQVNE